MLSSLLTGFASSLTLIVAIGAQNAFVLRQGVRGEHVFWVCLLCACSDATLIAAGVFGLGAFVKATPALETVMRIGGASFLAAYGARSLYHAWIGGRAMNPDDDASREGLFKVLATSLALTWLNPHVYLDTVVLLGSLSAKAPAPALFGAGAMTASFVFFFGLGYGARRLAPLFATPRTWRILDVIIGLMMIALAVALLAALE